MSYADRIREELIAIPVKRLCCKRALAHGLLLGAVAAPAGGQALLCKQSSVAEFALEHLRRQFGKQITLTVQGAYGRTLFFIHLVGKSVEKAVQLLQNPEKCKENAVLDALELSCEGCRAAFLRGAFLAGATVNDPHKSFHLEFLTPPKSEATLSAFLSSCGYEPRRIARSGNVGLYYKSSTSVEELITLMGAAHAAIEIINLRIEREIRNQENRATNCVAKNIEKSVSACSRQMEAIERLTLSGMLAQLPEGIRHTALLRAENPDATLEELRLLHEPPITKSGLNHRLQKILDAADKL